MKRYNSFFFNFVMLPMLVCTIFIVGFSFQVSYAKEIKIFITFPKNGQKIFLEEGESMPAQRPIKGYVEGITKEELADEQLLVNVSIKTDKWYPQGITRVKSDGSWVLRTAYFGGTVHLIRAELKDMNDNVLASTTATATIIQ